jgi:hypothetical protein
MTSAMMRCVCFSAASSRRLLRATERERKEEEGWQREEEEGRERKGEEER